MEPKTPDYPKFDKMTRDMLRLALDPAAKTLNKTERAFEAKERERRQKQVGTVITATKDTLLQLRELRDQLASDPRLVERHSRKRPLLFSKGMSLAMQQAAIKEMVDVALEGTPEGDIPDDWESSLVVLPENCSKEVYKEIDTLVGPEAVEKAHAILLRRLESDSEDEDSGNDSDEEAVEAEEGHA